MWHVVEQLPLQVTCTFVGDVAVATTLVTAAGGDPGYTVSIAC